MRLIKKLMTCNKGRSGDTSLKADVLAFQKKIQKITPDEKEHRVLNVFVNSYMEKL